MSEMPEAVMEEARWIAADQCGADDQCAYPGPCSCREQIAKAILADRQRDQWRDISTAPKDGRAVLLFGVWCGEISGQDASPSIYIGSFGDGTSDFAGNNYWNVSGGDAYACWVMPTHWQPLPAAPKGE